MWSPVAWLSTGVLVTSMMLAAAPTNANAADPSIYPVITSPGESASVQDGFTGPITIDFTHAGGLAYQVTVQCDDTNVLSTSWNAGNEQKVVSWTIPSIIAPAECTVTAYAGAPWGWDSQSFYVDRPPSPTVTALAPDAPAFFPLVREGYHDTTTINTSPMWPHRSRLKSRGQTGRWFAPPASDSASRGSHLGRGTVVMIAARRCDQARIKRRSRPKIGTCAQRRRLSH